MALLLVLLPDPALLARVRRAIQTDRLRHRLLVAGSWSELHDLASRSAPQLAIVDPYPAGGFALDACAGFRAAFPSVALLPYGDFTRGSARDVLRLAALGVREIVVRDQDDDPVMLKLILTELLAGSGVGPVLQEVEDLFPGHLLPWMSHLLSAASRHLAPDDAAHLYHRHPNTLREHLQAAGLPPVNKLIVWVRLFHAAHLLADPARSVEDVALSLDYPSVNALRNQLQRYVGLMPREVRARGGLPLLLTAFRERHRTGRWEVGAALPGQDAQSGAGE